MRGGPRKRSGQAKGDPAWTRTHPCRIMLRAGEAEDLATIAASWGVPLGTAAWALLHAELARIRCAGAQLGDLGLEIAASLRTLRREAVARDARA